MEEKLIIEDFKYFGGKHCQTAVLKNILDYRGLNLSEEMLFGLGGGPGFIYWYMKQMPSPFIGTRNGKVDDFLLNICKRIGAEADIIQTTSAKKGYEELKKMLRKGEPAYIFVDMAYLPYMAIPESAHFGGHSIVVYGLDEKENIAFISDRGENSVKVTIDDLKKARSSKFPPFPPKNKLLQIKYPSKFGNLEKGIKEGIKDCCANMLKPPIKNIGLEGMQKWADIVPKWSGQFKGLALFGCLFNTFLYIEISGTGGSAFRTMYAQFLKEASSILNKPYLNEVAELFEKSGKLWSEIATAALPDDWSTLKKIRELSIQKNKIFEKQKAGTLERMQNINIKLDNLMKEAVEDLQKKGLTSLLDNLKHKILECKEVEEEAVQMLSNALK